MNTPRRLIAVVWSKSSTDSSVEDPSPLTPALAITVSTGPNAASAASNAAMIDGSLPTSTDTASALWPAAVSSALIASSRSVRRAPIKTLAPAVATSRAQRSPIPDEAPVISTVRPARSNPGTFMPIAPSRHLSSAGRLVSATLHERRTTRNAKLHRSICNTFATAMPTHCGHETLHLRTNVSRSGVARRKLFCARGLRPGIWGWSGSGGSVPIWARPASGQSGRDNNADGCF